MHCLRSIVVLLLLSGCLVGDAWALTINSSTAVAGASSLAHTVSVTNEMGSPAATVTFLATNDGFLVPTGAVHGQYVADADFLTGSGTMTLTGYVDTTNTMFGTEILIGTATESTVPFAATPVPLTLAGPYALTVKAVLTLEPDTTVTFTHMVSVTADTATVPEADSVMLLACVPLLLILATPLSRRFRVRAAD